MIKLHNGDCLEVMKGLADNSVDSIVTDPPYELGFMGKSWDNTGIANNVDMWRECLRVLKPGGYLLSFSATRTYHRMTSAIEDAGFEIRDMIEWVYGCLSEDTEILTKNGWEQYRISKKSSIFANKEILIYDTENDIYKWEKPQRWNEYNIDKDTAFRIKSDKTDQIVSRNHRCLVEREGKLIFIKAEELDKVERVPTLSDDIFNEGKGKSKLLQSSMLWESKGLAQKLFSKRTWNFEPKKRVENGEKPSLERRFNLYETQGEICKPVNKICSLPKRIYANVKKRWLCNGTPIKNSNGNKKTFDTNRMCTSYKSRCNRQQNRKSNVIQDQCRTQKARTRTSYKTTLATVEPFEYSGIIFCPTVSTGAFVARRNGKIFLTGNSGFPKSLNIGKAVDKLQGNEREVIGLNPNARDGGGNVQIVQKRKEDILTKGTSEWEGWGTALKPAHEPICMARKPISENTVAENCLKWGTGGINIDESRVEFGDETDNRIGTDALAGGSKESIFGGYSNIKDKNIQMYKGNGRFPANLIHDGSDEVVACFPDNKGAFAPVKSGQKGFGGVIYGKYETGGDDGKTFYGDGLGNASRFFKSILYYPKASRSERNKGCDGLEDVISHGHYAQDEWSRNNMGNTPDAVRQPVKNNHPTVKPIKLMEYLIEMVTPENGTVLEPFLGSGTTGVACVNTNRNFIGIELDKDYFAICEKRIADAQKQDLQTKLAI